MAGSIFICYRRDDSVAYAGRLHDRLSAHFGKDRVFMDLDTIQPGEDFVDVLEGRVGDTDALIAIIGKGWLDCKNASGDRRLDDADDHVRREIAAALRRKIRVIPALVGGAHMPSADRLPPDISALSRRNAIEISDASFNASVAKLVEALENAIEAERQRRETERRQARPVERTQSVPPAEPRVSPEPALEESAADRESGASPAVPKRLRLLSLFAAFCVFVAGTYLMRKASTDDAGTVPSRTEATAPPVVERANSPNRPAASAPAQSSELSSSTTLVPDKRRTSSETEREPSAIARRPPPPPAPVRVGGAIQLPTKLLNVQPVYPPIAQSANVQGVVIIEATIGTNGHVAEAKVVRSIPLLDSAALDAVNQWVYTPTILNGVRVPVIMAVTVNFTLVSTRNSVVSYINRLEAATDVSSGASILRTVFGVTSAGTNAAAIFADLRQKVSIATEEQLSQIEKTIPR